MSDSGPTDRPVPGAAGVSAPWPQTARARLALLDRGGRVVAATEGALRAAGGRAEDLVSLARAVGEEGRLLAEALERALEVGESEVELVGGALHVRLSRSEQEQAPVLAEIEDRSEQVRARAMREALLASLERMGRQTSTLAHEIKNPLAALNLALRVVAGKLGEEPERVLEDFCQRLRRIERSLRRSLGYVQPIGLSRHEVSPAALFDSVTEALSDQASEAGVTFEVAVESGTPPAYGDDERLREALVAIVRNALEEPGVSRVWLAAAPEAGGVRLRIEDDGPGVPPSLRASLFEPFVSSRAEAAGMGLAEATRIAEAHGGRLELGDGEFGGACFLLHLPSQPEDHR